MKTGNRNKDARGFTLVELLITMAIFAVVAVGIYNVYIYLHKTWLTEDLKAEMQQKSRVALDTMVRDMMMMGYGSSEDHKIYTASPTELQFSEYIKGEFNGDGQYWVNYKLSGNRLTRTVYWAADLNVNHTYYVADQVQGGTGLAFNYYDQKNVLITDTSTDTQRDKIRRVTVTLVMQTAKPIPGTNTYKTMTLTADISPRNLVEGEMALDTNPPTTPTGLHVADTQKCGLLRAYWNKSTDNVGVAGYMLKYGTTSGDYTRYLNVPIGNLADPDNPSYTFSVDYSPYVGPDTSYYVTVLAYDAAYNYSDAATEVAAADPYPNVTGISGNDTTNNIRKPQAVTGFAATGGLNLVTLTWSTPADTNVVGYRIFRDYSAFNTSTDFPISDPVTNPRIKQLTKETSSGDSWIGARTDRGTTTFTDTDSKLIGCKTYYYAICPVTCDSSRIWGTTGHDTAKGGVYTAAQYSLASAIPQDQTKPSDPVLASRAGYKRVFLNVNWPNDNDYSYTKVYFTTGAGSGYPPFDPTNPSASDPYLISDYQGESGGMAYTKGTFNNYGTSSQHDIIFNYAPTGSGDTSDLPDTAMPTLTNSQTYNFRAVAFDNCGNCSRSVVGTATTFAQLCGDDPCGPPTWNVAQRYVWVNAATTNLDASTWTPNDPNGNTQIDIGLKWTPVDVTDPNTALDFWGYYVNRNVTQSIPGSLTVGSSAWNNYIESNGLSEGASYYYGIRAADCIYENITPDDVVTAMCNGVQISEDYNYVKANNITPDSGTVWSGAIKPGRFALYTRTDTLSTHPEYNIVSTSGSNHNVVNLYLENTSQAQLGMDWMKLTWGNSAAYLKDIIINNGGTLTTITPPGLVSNSSAAQINIAAIVNNYATGVGSPSDAIPVTLEFCNADGTVTNVDDMRQDTFLMEISFTNPSMPNAAGSTAGVSGFTTGLINGSNPMTFKVSGGPSINYVTQNKPISPTNGFEIDNVSTESSLPSGYPKVNGGLDTVVTANVTCPANETINSVTINYAYTDTTALNPNGQSFTAATTTSAGVNYSATIPGNVGKGVWYYVLARTAQGNFARSPAKPDSYYYFQFQPFDPCAVVPGSPTNLSASVSGGTTANLTWTAPTQYGDGETINTSWDTITYNVYRRIGLTGSFPTAYTKLTSTPISSTSYNDTGYVSYGTQAVTYVVTAVNNCPHEGNPSYMFIICPSGNSAVSFVASPSAIWAGDNITVNMAVCSAANNGASGEKGQVQAKATPDTDTFIVTESADTGTTSLSIPTTHNAGQNNPSTLLVIPVGSDSENITITSLAATSTYTYFSGVPVQTQTVGVWMKPCDNTPAAPSVSASRSGGNLTLLWTAVAANTDGSAASYTPPQSLTGSTANPYEHIVTYEIWQSSSNTDPNLGLSGWAKVWPTSGNSTSTSTTITTPKGTYYYAVRALDTCNNGTFSAVQTVTR